MTTPADFTEEGYGALLDAARRRFRFVDTLDDVDGHGIAIWRHDIDASPHRALCLARIESERGLVCFYYVLFGSAFYNAFEPAVARILRGIVALGHHVGLHFDVAACTAGDREGVERAIRREADMLSALLDAPVGSFSLHNPTATTSIKLEHAAHAGLVNASAPDLMRRFTYCSDSNGVWRHRPLADVVADPAVHRLYALTHPAWWVPEAMSPRQRIQRCIDGRAARVGREYDQALAAFRRPNQ